MFEWIKKLFNKQSVSPITENSLQIDEISNSMKKSLPETTPIPPIPGIPENQMQDYYRVGYDNTTGATTLTLHADSTSITLSLGPRDVMRLIRMLGATLDDEDISGVDLGDDYDD